MPLADIAYTAMIFLQDNTLLERDLTFDDIKPRLLGRFSPQHSADYVADGEGKAIGEHVLA